MNQHDRAIEAIHEALRITPGHARANFNLGAAYYGQGLCDKVRDVYAQLRKANPALAGQFAERCVKP